MESHEKDLRAAVEDDEQVRAIQADYRTARLSDREMAVLAYAEKLTRSPSAMAKSDLHPLRQVGLTDEDIVDAAHCVGYFNFINRVLDGLGVDPEATMRYGQAAK